MPELRTNLENIKECIEMFEDKLEISVNTKNGGILEEVKYPVNHDACSASNLSILDDSLNIINPFSIGM